MKKRRLVVFEILSQGKTTQEYYEIGLRDNAEKVGQALVIWFNLTGGNTDGSFRKFIKVAYDETFDSEKEYLVKPFSGKYGTLNYKQFRLLTVLGEDYEALLMDQYARYRGNDK